MRKIILATVLIFLLHFSFGQSAEEISSELNSINASVASQSCSTTHRNLISNRAMNVFLADKSGYLSDRGDLSLFTNYVTLNTIAGELTVNHNFHTAKGKDEPVRTFFNLGVKANIADGFASTFQDKKFNRELGLMLGYVLIGKARTSFEGCSTLKSFRTNHKQNMNALRAALVHQLDAEIRSRSTDFEKSLEQITVSEVPGQDLGTAKVIAREKFYADLKEEYAGKFASAQAEILTKTKNYKMVSAGWTIISAYIPLISPAYDVATSVSANFEKKRSFPFEVKLSHTRLWEGSSTGKIFISVAGKLTGNNSRNSYQLSKINLQQYQDLGGVDTFTFTQLSSRPAYIGNFENFLSPSLNAKITYFPPEWHLGISGNIEQNFGDFNILNARLGIPVVLINSRRTPALNFEFNIMFFDLSNKIPSSAKYDNKTAIGLSVGFPMSRLIY